MPRTPLALEAVRAGTVRPADLRPTARELLRQAEVARRDGNPQLADNLVRGAELVDVPEDTILRIYERLRPHRSTYAELTEMALELEGSGALANARLVRAARDAYRRCGTLAESVGGAGDG